MTEYFKKDGDDYVKVDEPLHTQDDLDKVVKDRADRIARQQFGDYDELKEKAGKVDTITKDFEDKLKERDTKIDTLTGDLGKAKLETDKVKIVHEFKLSDDLAEFVTGDTVDDMRAKAEKLAKGGAGGGKIVADKQPKPGEKATDSRKIAKGLFGNKSDD